MEAASERSPYVKVGLVAKPLRHRNEFLEWLHASDGCGPYVAHQAEALNWFEFARPGRQRLQQVGRITNTEKAAAAFVEQRPLHFAWQIKRGFLRRQQQTVSFLAMVGSHQ